MPRLLNTIVTRNPNEHAPARPTEPAIYTHPRSVKAGVLAGAAWPAAVYWPEREPALAEGATKTPASPFHDKLFAAWDAEEWDKIVGIAREHLESGGPASTPRMHPFSSAATDFFRPRGTAIAAHDVELFLASFEKESLRSYLERSALQDRNVLANHALALQCLGALGAAEFDPIAGLRALTAFAVAASAGRPHDGQKPRVDIVLIWQAMQADVYLPWWSFQIDPCRKSKKTGNWQGQTPFEAKLERLQDSRRVLGGKDKCVCHEEEVCTPQNPCCATIRYYIADLLELRDWTHRYKAGDLAYIEIIAVGETRSREHEMRRTKETFSEEVTSSRSLEKRDLQVTERASLQREIERQTEVSTSADASVEASYNAKIYSAKLTAAYSSDRTASEAIKETQQNARELVSNAVSEIEKEIRITRSERVTTEEIEKNVHAFTNDGDSPKVTKYFWVTQERRAQLFSYDKHLITELIIPSPARLFEKLLELRREEEVAKIPKPKGVEPVKPADIPFGAGDLTASNYVQYALQYGVASPPTPPALTKQVSETLSHGEVRNTVTSLGPIQLQVPQDYHATDLLLSGNAAFKSLGERFLEFWVGNSAKVYRHPDGDNLTTPLADLKASVTIDGRAKRLNSFSAILTLSLKMDNAALTVWQQAVFKLIKDSYDTLLAAYNKAFETWDAKQAEYLAACEKLRQELKEKETTRNPFYNREFERAELKRAAIYLMCQDYSTNGAVLPMAEPCGYPEIDRGQADTMGYDWYFWDRLFDWKHMSYAFFDYFWNPMCSWPDRIDPDEPDALFKAFRRAGYARVMVPVSPDMEKDFLWYVSTRQKWGQTGKPPLDPTDPRWRNVVFELRYASESAMTPREGHIAGAAPGDLSLLIKGSDRYWDPSPGAPDKAAIALDIDRELLIDGAMYLIADIQLDPNSPPYDAQNPDSMWWRITLSRPYEGVASPRQFYSMGAKAVAPVFSFDMPTDLIWAGAHNECLPSYPLPACPA